MASFTSHVGTASWGEFSFHCYGWGFPLSMVGETHRPPMFAVSAFTRHFQVPEMVPCTLLLSPLDTLPTENGLILIQKTRGGFAFFMRSLWWTKCVPPNSLLEALIPMWWCLYVEPLRSKEGTSLMMRLESLEEIRKLAFSLSLPWMDTARRHPSANQEEGSYEEGNWSRLLALTLNLWKCKE